MTACQTPLLVSLLEKSQELPVSQLARHVDPFHLVITDNWRPGTLSLLHSLAPPIKPTTHSSQSAALWSQGRQPSSLYFNKSLFSTHGMVFVEQFLASGAKTWERLTGRSGLGLVPWLHVLPSPGPRLLSWPTCLQTVDFRTYCLANFGIHH
jgi:hypothetical protein